MGQGSPATKHEQIYNDAVQLLRELIATPSFSREEEKTAERIAEFLSSKGIPFEKKANNIWAKNKYFDSNKPTILLNSHHDTVRPNKNYTFDPFTPVEKDGKLYGLGSNDAGASLVSLLAAFIHYYPEKELKYNLMVAATAEEENSGDNGIECILPELGNIDLAIVGEPTEMNLAIAERGLMVVDCKAKGTPSHAAHPNPDNAILNAMDDIDWIRNYSFPEKSEILGEVKLTVTIIHSGTLHNVVPDECTFTVDVRVNDRYSNAGVLEIMRQHMKSELTPRSLKLNSSSISVSHPAVQAGLRLGRKTYASPTTSDQAVIPYPSVKIGPGSSLRSHSADEFIYPDEIREGIGIYIELLNQLL
jgi:acetylornithine deacetylase